MLGGAGGPEGVGVVHDERKDELHGYLRGAREVLVWKLDGLGEHDVRRPLTPSGTNLLGLVKHSTATHLRYFGDVFDRSTADLDVPAADDPTAELWATPDESREDLVARYHDACAFADRTIAELPLDATGTVWWWGDATVSLHHVLVHVTAETQRHAGHADVLRELLDGSVGLLPGADALRLVDDDQRRRHRERVAAVANAFR